MTRHVTRPAPVCPAQTPYPGTFTATQLRNPGSSTGHDQSARTSPNSLINLRYVTLSLEPDVSGERRSRPRLSSALPFCSPGCPTSQLRSPLLQACCGSCASSPMTTRPELSRRVLVGIGPDTDERRRHVVRRGALGSGTGDVGRLPRRRSRCEVTIQVHTLDVLPGRSRAETCGDFSWKISIRMRLRPTRHPGNRPKGRHPVPTRSEGVGGDDQTPRSTQSSRTGRGRVRPCRSTLTARTVPRRSSCWRMIISGARPGA